MMRTLQYIQDYTGVWIVLLFFSRATLSVQNVACGLSRSWPRNRCTVGIFPNKLELRCGREAGQHDVEENAVGDLLPQFVKSKLTIPSVREEVDGIPTSRVLQME